MTDALESAWRRLRLAEKYLLEADCQMANAGFTESPWLEYVGESGRA